MTVNAGTIMQNEGGVVSRKFFDIVAYPLSNPVHAKYIVAKTPSLGEIVAMISYDAFLQTQHSELFHKDIKEVVEHELGEPVVCIGGGRLVCDDSGTWIITGNSTAYGRDEDSEKTLTALSLRFPGSTFKAVRE